MPPDVPRPIRIRRTPGGYKIEDAADRTLLYIYCRERDSDARAAHVLTWPEGEALAIFLARTIDPRP